MGLKMRITYQDTDHVYEILNGAQINKDTTQIIIRINGGELTLTKNEKGIWTLPDNETSLPPDFVQAIGRSVSLRYRM